MASGGLGRKLQVGGQEGRAHVLIPHADGSKRGEQAAGLIGGGRPCPQRDSGLVGQEPAERVQHRDLHSLAGALHAGRLSLSALQGLQDAQRSRRGDRTRVRSVLGSARTGVRCASTGLHHALRMRDPKSRWMPEHSIMRSIDVKLSACTASEQKRPVR